ncbi:MAG: hypothetical protein AAAC48_17450 [Phyllobacterium sp.]|jgi:hypothetical protein|uniref:hypothetical protein n=1 Tax=Phyllobacterium sp. TaxID=1871046 RepID=UPI0030F185FE
MKIFSLLRALPLWLRDNQVQASRNADVDWRRDPLSHPALRTMCLDQLADLPFDPRAVLRQ